MDEFELDATIEAIVVSGMHYAVLRLLLKHASNETLAKIKTLFPIE